MYGPCKTVLGLQQICLACSPENLQTSVETLSSLVVIILHGIKFSNFSLILKFKNYKYQQQYFYFVIESSILKVLTFIPHHKSQYIKIPFASLHAIIYLVKAIFITWSSLETPSLLAYWPTSFYFKIMLKPFRKILFTPLKSKTFMMVYKVRHQLAYAYFCDLVSIQIQINFVP